MKFTLLKYSSVLTFLILSVATLMHVSQNVQKLEREVTRYDREIDLEEEKIRILKAEWAYLNNPERLEALATGGYDLKAPDTQALVSDPAQFPNVFSSPSSLAGSGASSQKDIALHPQALSSHDQGGQN